MRNLCPSEQVAFLWSKTALLAEGSDRIQPIVLVMQCHTKEKQASQFYTTAFLFQRIDSGG